MKDLNLESNNFNYLPSNSYIYFKVIENLNLNYISFQDVSLKRNIKNKFVHLVLRYNKHNKENAKY